ncbi:MAG: hypothetical protein WCC12_20240 [Anaerolineales bacterium]
MIDQLSDPYTGVYPDPVLYQDSGAQTYDDWAYFAYGINGWDLALIAELQMNNPMDDEAWVDGGVDNDYIIQRGGAGSQNPVYVYFLRELKLDTNNYNNYEANYLDAMMRENNQELDKAKADFYNDLIGFHNGDRLAAYEWILMTKEAIGLPD